MSLQDGKCPMCEKYTGTFHLNDEHVFVCADCMDDHGDSGCRPFEYGHENPEDPKGSTAHVRDIKDRRWHPQEKRMFYKSKEMPGRTYFFSKG